MKITIEFDNDNEGDDCESIYKCVSFDDMSDPVYSRMPLLILRMINLSSYTNTAVLAEVVGEMVSEHGAKPIALQLAKDGLLKSLVDSLDGNHA